MEISQNFVAFSGYMKFRDSECFRIGLGVYKLLEKYCVKVMLTAIVVACSVLFRFFSLGMELRNGHCFFEQLQSTVVNYNVRR